MVTANFPTTLVDGKSPLIEAIAFPTDVIQGKVGGPNAVVPNVIKARFNVNVVIEATTWSSRPAATSWPT